MNINDMRLNEYYMFEFKIFKGEPPVLVKLVAWSDEDHTVYVVRANHPHEKPFTCTVANLRELTSGEVANIVSDRIDQLGRTIVGIVMDIVKQIVFGVTVILKVIASECQKYVNTIRCKVFDKHDIYWELDVQYSDSDHEHYLEGYCKDCGKRHTKGLYY